LAGKYRKNFDVFFSKTTNNPEEGLFYMKKNKS